MEAAVALPEIMESVHGEHFLVQRNAFAARLGKWRRAILFRLSLISDPGTKKFAGDRPATVLEVTRAFRQFAQSEEHNLDESHARGISRQKLCPCDTHTRSCGIVSEVILQLGWIGGDGFEIQVFEAPRST